MAISAVGQAVLDLLEAEGPELPVVVVARRTGQLPTRLEHVLDVLHEAGLVRPGTEPATVALARDRGGGRFTRPTGRTAIRRG